MSDSMLRVLLVDDSPDDIELVSDLLMETKGTRFNLCSCSSAKEAMFQLRYSDFDCMLIDYNMPGEDGFWVLEEVQVQAIHTPIIMMTGEGDEKLAVKALKSGAQDYLSKIDLNSADLLDSINYAIQRKSKDLEFLQRATRDLLTGVNARYAFDEELEHAISRARRSGRSLSVLFLDLDKFKEVNDQHGHEVGDQVLVEAADRMLQCLRGCDTLGRFGGDEFLIILEELVTPGAEPGSHAKVVERIHAAITAEKYGQPDLNLELGVSIGVALYPYSGTTPAALVRAADEAMYECKKTADKTHVYHAASRKVRGMA